MNEVFDKLRYLGCTVEPCGSRVTCSSPKADSDFDYLVSVPGALDVVSDVALLLSSAGFGLEGSEHYRDSAANGFTSWRRCDVNLIVSADADFVKRHRAATAVCTRLNLLDKADRVAVFQAVLYGNHGIEPAKGPAQ